MYTFGKQSKRRPVIDINVRSYHEDIDEIHDHLGHLPLDEDGKIIILDYGETDITDAYGTNLIFAKHGMLSKDDRTPGREKYVFHNQDYIDGEDVYRGFHPHRSVDAETGRKVWTWVVERPWIHPITGVKGRRQVVYVAKQSEDNPRIGILDNIYIPEEGEELPLSAPTPNDFVWLWQKVKAFFYL